MAATITVSHSRERETYADLFGRKVREVPGASLVLEYAPGDGRLALRQLELLVELARADVEVSP